MNPGLPALKIRFNRGSKSLLWFQKRNFATLTTMDVHFIYASSSGNVEKVVETVAEIFNVGGITAHLHRAEQTSIDVITANENFVLATSTWEHGVLNPFFKKLYEELQKTRVDGKKAAFIGLGDRRYEPVLFCQGMETVRQTWLDQGGVEIGEKLRMQGEPYAQLDAVVKPWAEGIMKLFTETTNA